MKRLYLIIFILFLIFNCKKESGDTYKDKEEMLQLYDFTDRNVEEFYENGNYNLIILNYWATFCSPCKEEMKDFAKLYNEYKDKNILIIGASVDSKEQLDLIKKIALFLNVSYPIVYGVKPNFKGNEITGIPKTFIIKDKEIKFEIDGKRDYNFFKEIIENNL
ncbi:MAG TPA: TlpA disulfide reductase family protein [Spirochaetota bacterium]|nr:TlpA disulfide reductase family protein [Spirochaetota bacterium]HOL56929.1 TlpA disulfide reductase family protein [Spirochaetota bacterium]HPP04643.1 TlpA disulfide reductase family protein [Spirochaetota bacterium]